MNPKIAVLIGLVFAVAGTIALYILVVPAKKRARLGKFLRWVHDVCNFRSLMIEHILKVLYIFSTLLCLVGGFFMLFSYVDGKWIGWAGILLMLLGPIVIRLLFEASLLGILHLKNTMEINEKIAAQPGSREDDKLKLIREREEEEAARAEFAQQYAEAQMQLRSQQEQPAQNPDPDSGNP